MLSSILRNNSLPHAVINPQYLRVKQANAELVLQALSYLERGKNNRAEDCLKKLKPSTLHEVHRAVYEKTTNIFSRAIHKMWFPSAHINEAWSQADNGVKIASIQEWLKERTEDKLIRETEDAYHQGRAQWGHRSFNAASSVMPIEHKTPIIFKYLKRLLQALIFPWGIYSLLHRDSSLKAVGLAHLQGRRPTMEDEHLIATSISPFSGANSGMMEFFGIFDGHAGSSASAFAKAHFVNYFTSALKKHKGSPVEEAAIFAAFKQACLDLDHAYKGSAGSTMSVAVIIGSNLWVCNLGDSRAVLVDQKGKAIQLSEDQKCDHSKYTKGVEERGGFIAHNRVNGSLAVPRALGDHSLPIVHTPKITRIPLSKCIGGKLVVACDGLFDVCSSNQVAAYVHKEKNRLTEQQLAENLVGKAYNAGSTDNISALVVSLK